MARQVALEPFDHIEGIKDDAEKKAAQVRGCARHFTLRARAFSIKVESPPSLTFAPQEIKAACLLNIAACHEKAGDWNQARRVFSINN